MEDNEKVLKIISNETIDSAHKMGVVTPTMYKSIFEKHASNHDTELGDEEKLTDKLLDSKITMCQELQEKTSDNAVTLSDHTTKAITAIRSKDEATLSEVLKETDELRKEIEKLKEAVYKDELTNTYNRKWLKDNILNKMTEKFKSEGTLAVIDLNYFKIINDSYGHIVGDKVLIFMANQLKSTKKSVIRYGGDEFLVVFDNVDEGTAFSMLEILREQVLHKMLKAGDESFRVSFSIGTSEYKDGDSLADIIEAADSNMYDDKETIKKRVQGIH